MASLHYLWKNRVKTPLFSILFFKTWLKRFLSINSVLIRNYRRIKLKIKGAEISELCEIGEIICNGNAKKLKIGHRTFIGKSVELALYDNIIIGNNVCINDNVKLLSGSHDINDPKWNHKMAPIIINDYAWVATNAIILPGVEIGKGAVVGAGAVVSINVPDYGVVVGNPAKILLKKRNSNLDYNPCEFLAANRAWLNS